MTDNGKQALFNLLSQEFAASALETEMQEIETIVLSNQEPQELPPLDYIAYDLYTNDRMIQGERLFKRWLDLTEETREKYRSKALMQVKNFSYNERIAEDLRKTQAEHLRKIQNE